MPFSVSAVSVIDGRSSWPTCPILLLNPSVAMPTPISPASAIVVTPIMTLRKDELFLAIFLMYSIFALRGASGELFSSTFSSTSSLTSSSTSSDSSVCGDSSSFEFGLLYLFSSLCMAESFRRIAISSSILALLANSNSLSFMRASLFATSRVMLPRSFDMSRDNSLLESNSTWLTNSGLGIFTS